jgi:hypothetical protein
MTKIFISVIISVMLVFSCSKDETRSKSRETNKIANQTQQVPKKTIEIKKPGKTKPERLAEYKQEISSKVFLKSMMVGEITVLPLTIKNSSSSMWKSGVHPYYQWIDSQKKEVGLGGSYFQNNVAAGESISIDMKVKAPDAPGKYVLRISMVQEDVAFFDKQGATPLEIKVSVKEK